jgi:hypothetical protein
VPTVSSCRYDGVTRWLKLGEFLFSCGFSGETFVYQFGDGMVSTAGLGKILGGGCGNPGLDGNDVWLPPRDSNPDKQIQNLLSYH